MFWYIVILLLLTILSVFFFVGEYRRINTNSFVTTISIGILLLFMSCRSYTVGADTIQYISFFEQIGLTPLSRIFKVDVWGASNEYTLNMEYGYIIYNKIISYISRNNQAILVANSSLCMILLYSLITKTSKYPFVSVWLYYTLGIFQTQMNLQRNAIAILLAYHGLEFIRKRKVYSFLLQTAVALAVHTSAMIFAPVYWIVNKIGYYRNVSLPLLFSILFGLLYFYYQHILLPFLPENYERYVIYESQRSSFILLGLFHLTLFCLAYYFSQTTRRNRMIISERIGFTMFYINVFFFCIGLISTYGGRIAGLFGPYLIILLPNMLAKGIYSESKRLKALFLIFVISGVQYVIRLYINNIGYTMPYEFFFSF